ncbi:hypothetical protein [Streptomyces sp. NRRL S-813]|uniref:hypothetical protein n=1 Tax=Streptomyces sp. NRRL S-813 TaxID=1463919 RepID=UPI0007C68C33|nr:hypothetical protein [Streptomyces sp. NRRL S-813]
MTQIPAVPSVFARCPRRPALALAVTALIAVTLAACGTEETNAAASPSKAAEAVDAQHTEASAGPDQQAAFLAMLNRVAPSCPSGGPSAKTLPTDDPATEAIEAPLAPTAPEADLDARDWCASTLHEERITQALWHLEDPTPAKVRKILNGLGYIDERIHDLTQSGAATRFFLDLRVKGGRLCLDGSAAGEETIVDACVAPETGQFRPSERM